MKLKHKPCPFCFDTEIKIQRRPYESCGGEEGSHGIPTKITCAGCGASAPEMYESDDKGFMNALYAWNDRGL